MSNVASLITEQYAKLDPQTRVVILHPNYKQQHRLLPPLLSKGHYVRLAGSAMDARDVWSQIASAWDTSQLKQSATVLIDEADRAQSAALSEIVVEKLLPLLGKGRIILMGRALPMDVLHHPQLKGKVALLPVDQDHMLTDYRVRPEGGHLIEVWGLGNGRVMIDGRQVDDWDGVLPRALFFYLIDKGMTTRSDIFESFWPKLSVREATNVFHVTKRKVNEVLGTDLTEFKASYYFLAPSIELQYDVSRFNYCVQESADAEPAEAERLLREAVALMRGPFISTLHVPWVEQRRSEISIAFTDSLIMLGRLVEARGDHAEALSWFMRAFRQSPSRPDVAEHVLQLCRQVGRVVEGKEVYRHHRSALATEEHKKVSEGVRKAAAALG
jgi:DNA-binding SARP family transcriptional activator